MTLTVYSKCIIIIVNTCPCLFVTRNVTKKAVKNYFWYNCFIYISKL